MYLWKKHYNIYYLHIVIITIEIMNNIITTTLKEHTIKYFTNYYKQYYYIKNTQYLLIDTNKIKLINNKHYNFSVNTSIIPISTTNTIPSNITKKQHHKYIKEKKYKFAYKKINFFIKKKEKKLQYITIFKLNLIKNYKKIKKNNWYWPTRNINNKNIINKIFIKKKNQGIEIFGYLGQDILATNNGIVVYTGNKIKGYGNLIIIKHNKNYLSTYSHNEKILVCTTDTVQAGQKIATMGKTDTNKTKLYFSIYYKGKPINPLLINYIK
ncbi:MAG: hypothetical protein CACLOHII_00307 [Candidatus Westeberhardia cardiocondylae]|nr:hypothetical protein [Candidatus Westeberhardia cardiocondylae]